MDEKRINDIEEPVTEEFFDDGVELVTLVSDDGEEIEFEIWGYVNLDDDDNDYTVLAEIVDGETNDNDVYAFRCEYEGEEVYYYPVEDEKTINKIFEKFNEMCDCECDCEECEDGCTCGCEDHD